MKCVSPKGNSTSKPFKNQNKRDPLDPNLTLQKGPSGRNAETTAAVQIF